MYDDDEMREVAVWIFAALCVTSCVTRVLPLSPQGNRQELPVVFEAPKGWKQLPVLVSESHVLARWADPASKPSNAKYVDEKGVEREFERLIPSALQVLCFPKHPNSDLWDARFPRYEVYAYRMGVIRGDGPMEPTPSGSGEVPGKTYRYDPEKSLADTACILAHAVQVGGVEVVFQMSFMDVNSAQVEHAFERVVKSIQLAGSKRLGYVIAGKRPGFIHEPLVNVRGEMLANLFEAQNRSIAEWLRSSCLPGWKCVEERGVWAQFQGDQAKPKKAASSILGVYEWLEKKFGNHVRTELGHKPVLVVMPQDPLFDSVFLQAANTPYRRAPHWVLTTTSNSLESDAGYSYSLLTVPLLETWFSERDPDLLLMMPYWLSSGVEQMLHVSVNQSAKDTFQPQDLYHIMAAKEMIRNGRSPDLKVLFAAHEEQVYGRYFEYEYATQCNAIAVTHFLLSPAIQKHRKFGGLVRSYLDNLVAAIATARPQVDAAHEQRYGESQMWRYPAVVERRDLWAPHAKQVRRTAFEATFKDWSARDWSELERRFVESL